MTGKTFFVGRNQTGGLFFSEGHGPSPDSFTMAFFQECWEIIKDDLVKVMEEFHNHGKFVEPCNSTFISLIPKKNGAKRISMYRPTSIVTGPYKIISKMISNWLEKVLLDIIDGNQFTFITGKHILNSVLIAKNCIEEYKRKHKKRWSVKLDLEEAYDKTGWDFLILF